jgi:hypothetical protein
LPLRPACPARRAVNRVTSPPECVVWHNRHMAARRREMAVSAARRAMPSGSSSRHRTA